MSTHRQSKETEAGKVVWVTRKGSKNSEIFAAAGILKQSRWKGRRGAGYWPRQLGTAERVVYRKSTLPNGLMEGVGSPQSPCWCRPMPRLAENARRIIGIIGQAGSASEPAGTLNR